MQNNQLIPIQEQNGKDFPVDARYLWEQLESKRKFSDFIKDKISSLKLVESLDFIRSQISEQDFAGNFSYQYFLTYEASLLIASRQDTDIGLKVAKKIQKSIADKFQKPLNEIDVARNYLKALEDKQALLERLDEAQPKIEFVEKYVESKGNITFRELAKITKLKEPSLKQKLLDVKIIYILNGKMTATSSSLDRKLCEIKVSQANGISFSQLYFTPKQIQRLLGVL